MLKYLRKTFPTWKWRGVRYGFGWAYEGTKGERTVVVRAYSVLPFGSDNDWEAKTIWKVTEETKAKITSDVLYMWEWQENGKA